MNAENKTDTNGFFLILTSKNLRNECIYKERNKKGIKASNVNIEASRSGYCIKGLFFCSI